MILIPAWIIVILMAMVSVDNALRYREERNLLLLGKVLSWGLGAVIYIFISLNFWNITDARAFARIALVLIPLTELAYRYAKVKWKI